MDIYIVYCTWGFGDNTGNQIIYVGTDLSKAENRAGSFIYPDEYNNWATIELWRNGEFLKTVKQIDA